MKRNLTGEDLMKAVGAIDARWIDLAYGEEAVRHAAAETGRVKSERRAERRRPHTLPDWRNGSSRDISKPPRNTKPGSPRSPPSPRNSTNCFSKP